MVINQFTDAIIIIINVIILLAVLLCIYNSIKADLNQFRTLIVLMLL